MTVDLCLLHSAWPGALHGPPRPNASARASWRCLACDGGMFTFGDGEYREVPSYDEQNWGDCVGEPAKLPSGGCRICVNPWQLLFFFFGCGTPPTSYLCREEVLEKSRIHRLGEIGRWTRSFLIRWAKGNFSYRVVHQGALSGSSGPARAVEICLARRGWRNGYSRVNSGRGVGWRPHPRDTLGSARCESDGGGSRARQGAAPRQLLLLWGDAQPRGEGREPLSVAPVREGQRWE